MQQKPWHISPSSNHMSSTAYPAIDWASAQKLKIGMTEKEAEAIVHHMQYYHHPVNAIVFVYGHPTVVEIALKRAADGAIEDISYKQKTSHK